MSPLHATTGGYEGTAQLTNTSCCTRHTPSRRHGPKTAAAYQQGEPTHPVTQARTPREAHRVRSGVVPPRQAGTDTSTCPTTSLRVIPKYLCGHGYLSSSPLTRRPTRVES